MTIKHTDYPYLYLIPVFLVLALLVLFSDINKSLFLSLNQLGGYLPHQFWSLITYCGDALPVFVLCVFFVKKYPQLLWAVLLSLLIGTLISQGLKAFFNTLRPLGELPADTFIFMGVIELKLLSFPSGHSMTAFVLATLLTSFVRFPYAHQILGILAGLITISRIMVGAHWPLDILAGATLGILIGWLALFIARRTDWGISSWGLRIIVLIQVIAAYNLTSHDAGFPFLLPLSQLIGFATGIYGLIYLAQSFTSSYKKNAA